MRHPAGMYKKLPLTKRHPKTKSPHNHPHTTDRLSHDKSSPELTHCQLVIYKNYRTFASRN